MENRDNIVKLEYFLNKELSNLEVEQIKKVLELYKINFKLSDNFKVSKIIYLSNKNFDNLKKQKKLLNFTVIKQYYKFKKIKKRKVKNGNK